MPRTKLVNGQPRALTAGEEAARNAEEAAWHSEQNARDKATNVAAARERAVDAYLEEQMAQRALQPDAPDDVKNWKAVRDG